jgi:shikimate kinase/3-dehydroquinate synthase
MRPLWLWGFMATGKTTLGRRIAELQGVPFRDLDEEIAARAGASVPELFRTRGEAGFRALEREALLASFGQPGVLALGGGSLLSRELRLRALDECTVVSLRASPETLLQRSEGAGRPLLEGPDRRTRLDELLEARALAYAECHGHIDTDRSDLETAARLAIELWNRDLIAVAAGTRTYSVSVGHGIGEASIARALEPHTSVFGVTDANVERHHGTFLQKLAGDRIVVLTPGEEQKTPAAVEALWRAASAAGCDRGSVFLGFGGGVVTDIAGFAAATFLRGVPWISAPTTLLCAVDAAVGGKTGVDLGAAKHAVGAFWQPRASVCDLTFLATERERGFRSALSEVVKAALIGDPELLTRIEASTERVLARDPETLVELVRRSIRVKANIVSRDERESRLRAVLNLGHTIGHALEAHSHYTSYTHGEAISLGLVAALRIGERLGVTDARLSARITALLERLGLPRSLDSAPVEAALGLVVHDKKRSGNVLRFVLVRDVGHVELRDLSLDDIRRALV